MLIEAALNKASERGQDLVEIAPQAEPPVCKIINYGNEKSSNIIFRYLIVIICFIMFVFYLTK